MVLADDHRARIRRELSALVREHVPRIVGGP